MQVDPMDPSAYSDAPKGSWGVGLEGQPRAADTTAGVMAMLQHDSDGGSC